MNNFKSLIADLRVAFTLVPWRVRPKILAILLGTMIVAVMDMVAVVLIFPVMQLATGGSIELPRSLSWLAGAFEAHSTDRLLILLLVAIVALMVVKNVATLLFRRWSLGIMATAQTDAAHTLFGKYMAAPWVHHRQRKTQDVLQALTAYVPAAFGVTSSLISLAVDAITAITLLIALLVVSPVATAVAIVFYGGSAWVLQAVLKRGLFELGERERQAGRDGWAYLNASLDGFKEVRLAGAQERFVERYSTTRRIAAHAAKDKAILNELPKYLLEVIMIVGILLVALTLIVSQPLAQAIAFLGMFAVGALRIVPALNRMVATMGVVRAQTANVMGLRDQVGELERQQSVSTPPKGAHAFPQSDIVVRDVSFTFPDADAPVLNSISTTIPAGQTIALVGGSGAGKTTFVELLLTLFEPSAGTITVDGTSIHDFPEDWRSQIGVVAQDVYLMEASLKQNVAFGQLPEDIDDSKVWEALRLAQLDEFVRALPDQLDTEPGNRGMRVSGGQKQRIGIARALFRNPQVLLLDEATSALDNETESRITETIRGLHGTMTIIVVAHRLSTVKHADQILFFSKGKIVDRGTMRELTERNAEFAELVRLGQLN